jgi:hypothetical protein
MWYTAAKTEKMGYKAGTIFIVTKKFSSVFLFPVKFSNAPVTFKTIAVPDPKVFLTVTVDEAREWCIKPSKDFDSVVEESIMICEASYC